MSLRSLTIPSDSAQWGQWLDEQLVSESLTSTIVELEIIAGDLLNEQMSLEHVMEGALSNVLANGLASAPEEVHQGLFQRPELLLQLQELVLIKGGDYWSSLISVKATGLQSKVLISKTNTIAARDVVQKPNASLVRRFSFAAAIAAVLLLALFIWQPNDSHEGWGLAQSGLLESSRPENEMLEMLADASHEWFNKTPVSKEQLIVRMNEYVAGCETIIAADLPQLSDRNRILAKAACRRCRAAFRKHLNDLEAGADFKAILGDLQETISGLERSLRELKG